jgi:hypothetical protein
MIMNKYSLALLLLASSSYAHDTGYKHFHDETAADSPQQAQYPVQGYTPPELKLYGEVGIHRVQKFKAKSSSPSTRQDKHGALSAHFGYQLHPNLSALAGVILVGTSEAEGSNSSSNWKTETDVRGTTLAARAHWPLTKELEATLTAGWMRWHSETEITVNYAGLSTPGKGKVHNDGTDPYWGLGLNYLISHNASLGLSYNRFKQDNVYKGTSINRDLEQSTLGLNLQIRL